MNEDEELLGGDIYYFRPLNCIGDIDSIIPIYENKKKEENELSIIKKENIRNN